MRFSYDVWGDAVNVAARMESHGVPDRIHVSEAFRAMTDGTFIFEERGTTDIKSIGLARTFFLVGDQQQSSRSVVKSCHPGPPGRLMAQSNTSEFRSMSAFGAKRTSQDLVPMSAFGGKADID